MSSDFHPLSWAEEQFLAGCKNGSRIDIGSERPDSKDIKKHIRADLVRAVLVQELSDIPLHAKGVRIKGAFIAGTLDLQGVDIEFDLSLSTSVLEKVPIFVNARLRGLSLNGTLCPGLNADHCVFDGSVFLRAGFVAQGEVALPGAIINGDLQVCEAEIRSGSGVAIFAPSIEVRRSVYLGEYPYDDVETDLKVDGAILFPSCEISRDFYMSNTSLFVDASTLPSASDGLQTPTAFSLNRGKIDGVLHFKRNQISRGLVNFSGLQARRLNDEPADEYETFPMRLDGFEYQAFSDEADTRLASRLAWLQRRPNGLEFTSQPYEHLANVLLKIGHRNDALDVLFEREKHRHFANRESIRKQKSGLWRLPFLKLNDLLLRHMIGYGYRPFLSLLWGILLISVLAVLFQKTWDAGDFAPNSSPILISADWVAVTQNHPQNPAEFWSSKGQAGQDYETFHALTYSADLLIPIVNLGQEDAWAPSTTRSAWGWHAWWVRWLAKIIGWVVTALGAAAVTGAIRRF
ncbi:MAG: hypothetical protein AAF429_03065 [Pseudomonadota bacterium]